MFFEISSSVYTPSTAYTVFAEAVEKHTLPFLKEPFLVKRFMLAEKCQNLRTCRNTSEDEIKRGISISINFENGTEIHS